MNASTGGGRNNRIWWGVGTMIENGNGRATTIKLAEHRVFSDSFKPLYNQGMSLVEEAAEYLDGD
ncbi:MAG: DUF1465 family protein, partial [Pseudomonadales bacterium]